MTLTKQQLKTLADKSIIAAHNAGNIISSQRNKHNKVEYKNTTSSLAGQVVTEVDHLAQAAILEVLLPTCDQYKLALLTEESPDNQQRHSLAAFWCIDPMDGTLSFTRNISGFSVSIGLVEKSGKPLLGTVYDPVSEDLYQSISGQGAFLNNRPIALPAFNKDQPLILRTDFSFTEHPWFDQTLIGLEKIAKKLGLNGARIDYRNGAVLNACTLLSDANICYFKYPHNNENGGSLWDFAATASIFSEAKAVACNMYGGEMDLNRAGSTFMSHQGILFAAQPDLAQEIILLHQTLSDQS